MLERFLYHLSKTDDLALGPGYDASALSAQENEPVTAREKVDVAGLDEFMEHNTCPDMLAKCKEDMNA